MSWGSGEPVGHHPTIAVVMIVRNEEESLPSAVASVNGWADQIVVYDTGSTDRTREVAESMGAHVVAGFWDDDFSRARNDALAVTDCEWVLSLDADERVLLDDVALRRMLATHPTRRDLQVRARAVQHAPTLGFTVLIDNIGDGHDEHRYQHPAPRLFRRDLVQWQGAVHEQPVAAVAGSWRWEALDPALLSITHTGYSDPEVVRQKALRNVALLQTHIDDSLDEGRSAGMVGALVDLGRSQVSAGLLQDAVETFETVRELSPGTIEWAESTDFLARLLLADGQDDVVVVLADELGAACRDQQYASWLRAQALAYLGEGGEALRLLRDIDELVDPAGRRYDFGRVLEMRSLVAQLVGNRAEAVTALVAAMLTHGRIEGRGSMFLELCEGAEVDDVSALLSAQTSTPAYRKAFIAELSGCGPSGMAVASAWASALLPLPIQGGASALARVDRPVRI